VVSGSRSVVHNDFHRVLHSIFFKRRLEECFQKTYETGHVIIIVVVATGAALVLPDHNLKPTLFAVRGWIKRFFAYPSVFGQHAQRHALSVSQVQPMGFRRIPKSMGDVTSPQRHGRYLVAQTPPVR